MYQSVARSGGPFIGEERSFERRRRNDPLTTWKNANIKSGIPVRVRPLDRQPTWWLHKTTTKRGRRMSQPDRLMGAGNDKLVSVGRPNQR